MLRIFDSLTHFLSMSVVSEMLHLPSLQHADLARLLLDEGALIEAQEQSDTLKCKCCAPKAGTYFIHMTALLQAVQNRHLLEADFHAKALHATVQQVPHLEPSSWLAQAIISMHLNRRISWFGANEFLQRLQFRSIRYQVDFLTTLTVVMCMTRLSYLSANRSWFEACMQTAETVECQIREYMPENMTSWARLKQARGLLALSQQQDAEEAFAEALALTPTGGHNGFRTELWLDSAQAALAKKRFREAVDLCNRAIESEREDGGDVLRLAKSFDCRSIAEARSNDGHSAFLTMKNALELYESLAGYSLFLQVQLLRRMVQCAGILGLRYEASDLQGRLTEVTTKFQHQATFES